MRTLMRSWWQLVLMVGLSTIVTAYGDNALISHGNLDSSFEDATPQPPAPPVVTAPTAPAVPSQLVVQKRLEAAILNATAGLTTDAQKTVVNAIEEAAKKADPRTSLKISDIVASTPDLVTQEQKDLFAKELKQLVGDEVTPSLVQTAAKAAGQSLNKYGGSGTSTQVGKGDGPGVAGKEGAGAKDGAGAPKSAELEALKKIEDGLKKLGEGAKDAKDGGDIADALKGLRGGGGKGDGKGDGGGGKGDGQDKQPQPERQAKKDDTQQHDQPKERKKSLGEALADATGSNQKKNDDQGKQDDKAAKDKQDNNNIDFASLLKKDDKKKEKDKIAGDTGLGESSAAPDLAAANIGPGSDPGPSSLPQAMPQPGSSGSSEALAASAARSAGNGEGGLKGNFGGQGNGSGTGGVVGGDLSNPSSSYDGVGGMLSSKYNSSQALYQTSSNSGEPAQYSPETDSNGSLASYLPKASYTIGSRMTASGYASRDRKPGPFGMVELGYAYLDKKRNKIGVMNSDADQVANGARLNPVQGGMGQM